ncbi:Gmad2 immunoglobulin-like domain-containing protein [Spirilliplanes yamanashiensis]|uniref:GerMN domain-containing protein n=1 Tax=Spirilliplanes yamanashiensis TaxID=42233 RepID=A0A8J3YF18_9ACTN|nr:Gmad2 immunoglobulin-like domain-containing protein [Spirilliplanes yamanashiensis]MDP9818232.1 hypothetical protein [Spirilliplanes yamanashiensis]GIJ06740.1 hypothetical protein Sya03_60920 [Spirilliplanes yamanashiensis]
MNRVSTRRRFVAVAGVFVAIALVVSGIWFVVRDRGGGAPTAPPAGPPTVEPAVPPTVMPSVPPSPGPATMTVTIFFHRGQDADPAVVVPVRRTVPRTARIATAALRELLSGPTAAERQRGHWSHFSAATAGMLRSVRVSGGVARADFRDFRRIIPNASASAGSAALLAELDHTLRQFSTVRATVYSFNGDVRLFYEWLQMEPPAGTTPTLAQAQRVARDFLVRVVGMTDPGYRAARWRSDAVATVDFRPRAAGDRSPRPGGPVTTVVLGKGRTSFTVLETVTGTIRVDTPRSAVSPTDLAVVTSPVVVAGAALAFEGTVSVRVVQATGTGVRQLGAGQVTGGGDVMRPFTGTVSFAPPGAGLGWVIAFERSAADGAVTKATSVRVGFAGTDRPRP